MTLTQLRRFLALAEIKNFHAAADRLHITQPALSQSIQKLEASIGDPLFVRGPRGVELTEAGKLLVPRAKLILKFSDDFASEIDELRGRREAKIRVGVAPYFARDLFPTAFARFAERLPNVFVDVQEGQSLELIRAIEEGELDMAFCVLYDEARSLTTIDFERLCRERYSLFARTGHPLFDYAADALEQLSEYPWVVVDRDLGEEGFASAFESRGLSVPRFAVETRSLQVMISIVCASDHIAMIANDFARPEVLAGRIRAIEQGAIELATTGGIFLHPDIPKSPALEGMIAALREVCGERSA